MVERNPFMKQGKTTPSYVREFVLDKWLRGSQPSEIGRQLNIERRTISNIVSKWLGTGNCKGGIGGNRTRTARTDDVVYYTEFCKRQRPSILAEEIQKLLVDNLVVLPENVPSQSSVSRALTQDLGYTYKKIKAVPRESLTENIEEKLARYLAICSVANPNKMFFFDECSVIKTTGNRIYGHAALGKCAFEVQRYASNATYTVNLLHNIFGVQYVNIIPGPSNGLELLNFFDEAIEQVDIFGNPLFSPGDVVVMDNCGFHHALHVKPVLENMLALQGTALVFQPPYHPIYNTCEQCFRFLKSWLRKNTELAENQTELCIYDALSRITQEMSRNFFRHAGYIV